jgi:subtilase family serine protease
MMRRIVRTLLAIAIAGALIPLTAWARDATAVKMKTIGKTPARVTKAPGTTKSAKPDLVVSIINFSPGNPVVDAEITLWVFVKNLGHVPSGASSVKVKVGGESNPPVIPVPSLNPSQQFKYTKKVTFDRTGNFIVTATADPANDVAETNEGNNVKKRTIRVRPAPKPDLVITKINFSPGSPAQHEQAKVWVFVKNLGPGASKPCYVSKTSSMNNYSIWSKRLVPALPPGKEWRFDGYFISNMAGTYTIRAVIDRENTQEETNENNNMLERQIVVRPPAQ